MPLATRWKWRRQPRRPANSRRSRSRSAFQPKRLLRFGVGVSNHTASAGEGGETRRGGVFDDVAEAVGSYFVTHRAAGGCGDETVGQLDVVVPSISRSRASSA